jgi:hypothetical protein
MATDDVKAAVHASLGNAAYSGGQLLQTSNNFGAMLPAMVLLSLILGIYFFIDLCENRAACSNHLCCFFEHQQQQSRSSSIFALFVSIKPSEVPKCSYCDPCISSN